MKSSLSLIILFSLFPIIALAQPVEWPVSEGGNGHYYEFVLDSGTARWWDDNIAAMSKTHEGLPGHLATLTSFEENNWVIQNVLVAGQVTAQVIYLGGWNDGFLDPAYTWRWITGEEWSYTDWAPNQPSLGNEHALCYLHEYVVGTNYWNGWNDLSFFYSNRSNRGVGHLVEYDNYPVVDLPPVHPIGIESSTWGNVKVLFR